jgi:glycosyltransferase involved in cell wall biosynthesis
MRPRLLFVSPRFLFPVDSGGKIRTTQILRGMKGGHFHIQLASPASAELAQRHQLDLHQVCDEFLYWPADADGLVRKLARAAYLLDPLPIPVRTDRSRPAQRLVREALDQQPDVVVFDFLHSAVLAPADLRVPSVLFTHNVEAEIFLRHRDTTRDPLHRMLWANQSRKMLTFEKESLSRFDVVVAVSERDGRKFAADYGCQDAFVIPTGVDTDHFRYVEPASGNEIVFCGSMDWLAN